MGVLQVRAWMTAVAWLLALLVLALPRTLQDKPPTTAAAVGTAAREVRAFSINAEDKDPDEDPDVVIRVAKKTAVKK
jgi:hypothetical protein